MQAQEIITTVRRQLVETTAAFWGNQELLDLLNDAERDFNNRTRILEGKLVTDVIQGQSEYPLPSNWLSTRALFVNNPDDLGNQNWYRIQPTNLEKNAQENPNFLDSDPTAQDNPRTYMIWNNILTLLPIPETTVTGGMVMFFRAKPIPITDPTQDINIDDTFKDALVNYMLWKAWKKEKEQALAKDAQADYSDGIREGRKFVKKRSADQKYKIDIISSMPFTYGESFVKGFNPFSG